MPPAAADLGVAHVDPAAPWLATIGAAPSGPLVAGAVTRVRLRYDDTKAALVHDEEYEAVLWPLPATPTADGLVQVDYDDRDLLPTPPAGASYRAPEAPIATKTYWTALRKAVVDHLASTRQLELFVHRELKLYSRPGETREEFLARCSTAAEAAADAEVRALRDKAAAKVATLQQRRVAAERAADAAEADRRAKLQGDVVGGLLGGLFGGSRSRTSVVSATKRAQAASAKVDAAKTKIGDVDEDIAALEAALADDVVAIDTTWQTKAAAVESFPVALEKTDITVGDVRLVWIPAP
jgi:hypothetical protein